MKSRVGISESKATVEEFWKLCAHVNIVYDLYRRLFEVDADQLDLYKTIAPFFFGDLNAILVEYVLLQFNKITDPAKTGRNYNLTTNYILQEIDWPPDIRERLERVNERLLSFREYIEPARSKRVAHIDLHSQLAQRASLGGFPKNAEKQFLRDLQTFVDIAYGYFNNGDPLPITVAMSTDTDNLVRALEKSVIFDQCSTCNETDRTVAVLDYEERRR